MELPIRTARSIMAVALASVGVWSAAPSAGTHPVGVGQGAANQNNPGFAIAGVVVDGKTGQPVEGVTVTLLQRGTSSPSRVTQVTSDQRGAFTLRAPAAGDYSVSAFRPPTSFGEFDRDPFSQSPIRWFAVPRPTKIVVRLWDFAEVSGSVTDEAGQLLVGSVVRALRKVTLGGRSVLKSVPHTGITDDRGRYVLGRLAPGAYVFVATPPVRSTPRPFRRQYYIGGFQPSAATEVHLGPSQTQERVDFQLRRASGYRVSGVVDRRALSGDPVRVELFDASPGELSTDFPVAEATITPDGRFEILGVVSGSYELRFVRFPRWRPQGSSDVPTQFMESPGVAVPRRLPPVPDEATWWLAEHVEVVDRDVSVSLRLREGARVRGRVVFEGPEAPPSPETMLSHGIYVRSVDHRFFGAAQVGGAREDRSFTTIGLPFGRYVLGMLSPYPGFRLESVRVGGREVAGVGFDLDGDITDAVVVLAARTTAITGRIEGARNEDTFVIIWPEDRALWSGAGTGLGRIYRAVTSDGSYRVHVFPGAYRVAAMAGLPPVDWESAEYLAGLTGVSQRVVTPAGQTVTHNTTIVVRR